MDVILPKIALTMTEATIVRWFKEEGQEVAKGEILFSMETDKTNVDVESPGDGVLEDLRYGEGDVVQAGSVVARLRDDHAAPDSAPATTRREVAPAAAALAEQLGVDLDLVVGTGTGGRVLESDVIKATAEPAASSRGGEEPEREPTGPPGDSGTDPRVERVTFSRARSAGMRLTRHATDVPTFLLGGVLDFEDRWSEMEDCGATVTDVLAVAAAGALKDVPLANARASGDAIERYLVPRIGILARSGDALVPLVFEDPSETDVVRFREERRRANEALEQGHLAAEHSLGATFVISNLGPHSVDFFSAVLFPQTAITLAVGSLGTDSAAPRALRAVLTCDHRIVDGLDAAGFFSALRDRISRVPIKRTGR